MEISERNSIVVNSQTTTNSFRALVRDVHCLAIIFSESQPPVDMVHMMHSHSIEFNKPFYEFITFHRQ